MQLIKNAMIYRLNREVSLIASEFEHQMKAFEFKGCGSQDMAKVGWFPPLGKNSESLCHVADGNILIVVKREEKILPATVIKEELDDRVEKLEVQQQRKLKKTEKDSLRDEVLQTLLPRAFSRYSLTNIWLEKSGLIIVDSASAKKAEDALALLRKTIGSLPVIPLTMESPVELTITEWVRNGDMPAGFTLGSDAELKAILEDGGVLRVNKQDLVSDEIANHIEAGKLVTKLALNWQDRIDFVLSDDGSIKRIKLCDTIMGQNDDIDREDQLARFDADFILQAGEISALIADTVAALGGEVSR